MNEMNLKNMSEKKNKITRIMLNILISAPVIGAVVFTILFKFVLTDRLEERIVHSMTVILLWMFATLFYIMILSHFKEAKKMMIAAFGMLVFIFMAVAVTPLDRYVNLVFEKSHSGSYIAAGAMIIIFYVVSIVWRKKVEG